MILKFNKRSVAVLMIVSALLASFGTYWAISSTPFIGNLTDVYINPPMDTFSAIVGWYNSTFTYFKNGTTGQIVFLSTNASLTVQNALGNCSNGQSVFLRNGDYPIQASDLKISSGVTLVGESMYNATLINQSDFINKTGIIRNLHFGSSTIRDSHITIRNLHLDGDAENGFEGFGIYMENVDWITLERIFVERTMEGGIEFNTLTTRNGTYAFSGGNTYAKHVYASYIYAEYCGTDSFSVGTLVTPYASEDVHVDHFYSYKSGYTGGHYGTTNGNGLTFSNVDGIAASNIYINLSFSDGNGMVSWGSRNAVVNNIFIRQMSGHGLEISEASASYPSNNWLVSNFDLEYNNGANLYVGYQTSNCSFINGLCTFSLANDGINVSSKCYRNFFTNVQTAWNNQYGLETHTVGSPYITNCEFLSNGAGAILNSPTFLTSCAGFVTENADNQTLCVNGTTIDHGLAGTPISVTLTIRGTTYINATCWYFYPTVYSIDATHITISFYWNHAGTVEPVSGSLNQTIYWQAVYSP